MLERFRSRSLQVKTLIFYMTMAVTIILVLGGFFYENAIENLHNSKEKELLKLAEENANKIERFLFERSADMDVLSKSNILTNGTWSDFDKILYLNNIIKAYKTYDYIVVLDLDGNIVLGSKAIDTNEVLPYLKEFLNNDAYQSDIIEQNKIDKGDPIEDDSSKKLIRYMLFSQALYDDVNQKIGVVISRMNFEDIDEILESIKLGESGMVKLVSQKQVHEDIEDITYEVNQDKRYITAKVSFRKLANDSPSWVICISQEEKEAFALKKELERYFFIVLIISVVIIYIVSQILSRIITEPIRKLVSKTNEHIRENLSIQDANSNIDEVKYLASSFELLLNELKFLIPELLNKTSEVAYHEDLRSGIEFLFEKIESGIISIDHKGCIKSFNLIVLKLLGKEFENEQGRLIFDNKEEKYQALYKLVTDCFKTKSSLENFPVYLKNHENMLLITTIPQLDAYNNLIGISVIVKSGEAVMNFEQKVIRAKHLSELGILAAGVAHEIRNPLTSIRGYAQLIESELEYKSQAWDDLQIIMTEIDRLDRLIERFMTFAKPNKLQYKICHFNSLMGGLMSLLKPKLDEKQIAIKFNLTDGDKLEMDEEQIKQVLLNVLLNAVEAVKENGEISIITDNSNTFFICKIIDNGSGIEEKKLEMIFTPFFTTKESGTGLGLAICQSIVEKHRGEITVNSTPNEKTTVTIKLPMKRMEY